MAEPIRYWCNTHKCPAPQKFWSTYIDGREFRRCDPSKGRICIPCCVIDCEEVGIEIYCEEDVDAIKLKSSEKDNVSDSSRLET